MKWAPEISFGIKNFTFPKNDVLRNDKYYIDSLAGTNWLCYCTEELTENGVTYITMQFFADPLKIIKSHTIRYSIKSDGNKYTLVNTEFLYESQYLPLDVSDLY